MSLDSWVSICSWSLEDLWALQTKEEEKNRKERQRGALDSHCSIMMGNSSCTQIWYCSNSVQVNECYKMVWSIKWSHVRIVQYTMHLGFDIDFDQTYALSSRYRISRLQKEKWGVNQSPWQRDSNELFTRDRPPQCDLDERNERN